MIARGATLQRKLLRGQGPEAHRHLGVRCHAEHTTASKPKGVVITGGSKGLGFAMAREFLQHGDSVVICGRQADRLAAATASLESQFPPRAGARRVSSCPCDVSLPGDVDRLAAFAAEQLGTVDIWVNNAGQVTGKRLLADVPSDEILQAVGSNVLGSLLGSRAAIRLMRERAPPGTRGSDSSAAAAGPPYHVFNLGFSSWGAAFSKTAVTHKSTKVALTQLTLSLAEELQAAGLASLIGVHNLSPGLVLTDLLLKDASPVARRFFNTLADEPEVVAAALVPKIRAVRCASTSVEYLTPASALTRVAVGLPQILNGGRFFDREGRRVQQPGDSYNDQGVKVLFEFPSEKY